MLGANTKTKCKLKKKLKNIDKLNDLSETKYLNWLTNDN